MASILIPLVIISLNKCFRDNNDNYSNGEYSSASDYDKYSDYDVNNGEELDCYETIEEFPDSVYDVNNGEEYYYSSDHTIEEYSEDDGSEGYYYENDDYY